MKNSPNDPSERRRPPTPLTPEDAHEFGFADPDGDEWLKNAAAVAANQRPGSLGEYTLLQEVGHGGQGIVYRALQPRTGREVALKLLVSGSFSSSSARRRFEREVEAASSLDHPGLVTVYGLDEIDGVPVLAMEWVPGVPATDWARGRVDGVRPTRDVLEAFARICDAVAYAHRNGILHRDIKPSNVLIDDGGRPRVLDFGLARAIDDQESLTRSDGFVGTPGYAPPEQIEGERVDIRGDVFSLGVLAYEMLTGERPYRAQEGLVSNLRAMERADLVRPSALRSDLTVEVDAVVLRALASEPEERYATVSELYDDVARLLSDRPVHAHPPSAWYELRKLVRRNRLASGLVISLIVVLAVFSAVSAQQSLLLAAERNAEADARRAADDQRKAAEQARHAADNQRELAEQARRSADDQREAAEKARSAAEEAQANAEEAQATAEEAAREAQEQTDRAVRNLAREQILSDYLNVDFFMHLAREVRRGKDVGLPTLLAHLSERADERFGEHLNINVTMHTRIGATYRALGMLDEAEREHLRAIELKRELKEQGFWIGAALEFTLSFDYGMLLSDSGRYAEAAPWLDLAAEMASILPDSSPSFVDLMQRMAADTRLRAGHAEGQGTGTEESEHAREYAIRVEQIDDMTRTGRTLDARQATIETYEWAAASFGANSLFAAQSAHRVGNHHITEDSDVAEVYLREALRVFQELNGEDSADAATALSALGLHLSSRGRPDEARAALAASVEIAERVYGPMHVSTARTRVGYSALMRSQGEYAPAIDQLRMAIEAFRRDLYRWDPQLRDARLRLAATLLDADEASDSLEEFTELIADYEADGDRAPADLHNGVALAYAKLGERAPAFEAYDRYFRELIEEAPAGRATTISQAAAFFATQVADGAEEAVPYEKAWSVLRDGGE